ncbi:MAG: hypothetical protein WC726_01675 [Parcubacteria group bacterium]|jgi:hypothetical protein
MKRKRGVVFGVVLAMVMVMFWAFSAQAFTITDPSNDAIGTAVFETYGMNVYNYTPGANLGAIKFSLFTNFPQAGTTVNGSPPWTVTPADVFITETYFGNQYTWAVPLVTHGSFSAGSMYAVGSSFTSDHFDPSGGTGYVYNHNVPVQIATVGNNYGYSSFAGGPVSWNSLGSPGLPDWRVDVTLGVFQDDPNGVYSFLWEKHLTRRPAGWLMVMLSCTMSRVPASRRNQVQALFVMDF